MPAAARVRRSADFSAVLRHGRRARRGGVVVHAGRRADPHPTGARVGFVVSKAVGGAVTRNLVKRRLRHLAAQHLPDWPADTDFVVRALPDAATAGYDRLDDDLTAAVAATLRRRQ
nr:ribonuclease P protein component [Stackebrandtia albiflava]